MSKSSHDVFPLAGGCCSKGSPDDSPHPGHDPHDHDHHGHDHHGHDHHGHDHDHGGHARLAADGPALSAGPGQVLSRLRIGQMDCPTEETLIRKKLGGMPDVHGLEFNLMQRVLTVVHAEGARDAVLRAIHSLGMTPEPMEDAARPAPAKPAGWRLL
ncbi:cation transporter, partial [Bordetella hinzii]